MTPGGNAIMATPKRDESILISLPILLTGHSTFVCWLLDNGRLCVGVPKESCIFVLVILYI